MSKQIDCDWQYYLKLPDQAVEPWQACALSLHIDPATMNDTHTDYLVGPSTLAMYGEQPSTGKIDTLVEFKKRLHRLRGFLGDPRFFTRRQDGKIRLPEFVQWLRQLGIQDIPLALLPSSERESLARNVTAGPWDDSDGNIMRAIDTVVRQLGDASDVDFPSGAKAARRDLLDPAIDKAVSDTGSQAIEDLWPVLMRLADQKTPPFTGQKEKQAGLRYTNAKGEIKIFTKDACSKRLARRREASGDTVTRR
jgi:hypothetical protein